MSIKVIRRTRPHGPRIARYLESVQFEYGPVSGLDIMCPLKKNSRNYECLSYSVPKALGGEVLYEYKRMVDDDKSSPSFVRVLVPITRIDRRTGKKYVVYRYKKRRIPRNWIMKNCHHVAWESCFGGKREVSFKYEAPYSDSVRVTDRACPHSNTLPNGDYTSLHAFIGQSGLRRRVVFAPVDDFIDTSSTLLEGVTDTDWWDPFLPVPGSELLERHLLELDRIALDVMVPQLDTGFSLPVFIGDLYQMKGLFRSLKNISRDLSKFFTRLGKRTVKHGADKYLESIYGWIPFVKDTVTIFEKLWHLDTKISEYLANANKRQTLHFQRGLAPPSDFKDPSWFERGPYSEVSMSYDFPEPTGTRVSVSLLGQGRREISDYELHSTLDFEYQIPRIIGLSARMQTLYATLETFGVGLSLADVWEIVPFSFVVDWVLGVGDWLDDLEEIHGLPVNVVIHDYCRSIRYKLQHVVEFTPGTTLSFRGPSKDKIGKLWPLVWSPAEFTPPSTEVSVETLTSYYRRAGTPVFDKDKYPGLKTPKGLQLVSAAALVAQRMFR